MRQRSPLARCSLREPDTRRYARDAQDADGAHHARCAQDEDDVRHAQDARGAHDGAAEALHSQQASQ